MVKFYSDTDADISLLENKTVAIFGYGSQGRAQAKNLRDSKVAVVIGVRADGPSAKRAADDGFKVYTFLEAAKQSDIIHFLLPDEVHAEIYEEVKEYITPGKTLSCSHGFSFHYELIEPPSGVDVIMVAPKGVGPAVRKEYLKGSGVPCLVAVYADSSGSALPLALSFAKANGFTRCGAFETTFKDETETDLFGEQNVLCGGAAFLMKTAFDVLVEAGYPPELAYFECVHELKLVVDLVNSDGIYGMAKKISNTARFGQFFQGKNVITETTKREMERSLGKIQSGEFAKEWIEKEYRENNLKNLDKMLADSHQWRVEQVGREVRKLTGLDSERES